MEHCVPGSRSDWTKQQQIKTQEGLWAGKEVLVLFNKTVLWPSKRFWSPSTKGLSAIQEVLSSSLGDLDFQ